MVMVDTKLEYDISASTHIIQNPISKLFKSLNLNPFPFSGVVATLFAAAPTYSFTGSGVGDSSKNLLLFF